MCDDIIQYDHTADTWATIGKLPKPIWGLRCVAYDGKLIVTGGRQSKNVKPDQVCEDAVMSWDGSSWTDLPSMSCPRAKHCCQIVDDKMIVAGGYSCNKAPIKVLDSAEAYDFKSGKWEKL